MKIFYLFALLFVQISLLGQQVIDIEVFDVNLNIKDSVKIKIKNTSDRKVTFFLDKDSARLTNDYITENIYPPIHSFRLDLYEKETKKRVPYYVQDHYIYSLSGVSNIELLRRGKLSLHVRKYMGDLTYDYLKKNIIELNPSESIEFYIKINLHYKSEEQRIAFIYKKNIHYEGVIEYRGTTLEKLSKEQKKYNLGEKLSGFFLNEYKSLFKGNIKSNPFKVTFEGK